MDQVPRPRVSMNGVGKTLASVAAPVVAEDSMNFDEWTNAGASAQARRAANARQASGRRRFVDPTTCERDYSKEEMDFMAAMDEYKKRSGRLFPTWSEILEVLTKELGYRKVAEPIDPDARWGRRVAVAVAVESQA